MMSLYFFTGIFFTLSLNAFFTQLANDYVAGADILVAAVGRAKMVKADMVKPGAVVIDVGMNRDENGRLCGDVDYEAVRTKVSRLKMDTKTCRRLLS